VERAGRGNGQESKSVDLNNNNNNKESKITMKKVFQSLAELINHNQANRHKLGDSSQRTKETKGFDQGTKTYDEAVAVAGTGWNKGAERVAKIRASLDAVVQRMTVANCAQMIYGVEGEWVDIGRIATGEPECCGSWHDQGEGASQKVVKIVANVAVSCGVSAETIFARGAATLAAVDLLESLGFRCEVWASKGCSGRVQSEFHTLVKEASQPVELDRLAFCLCHPAMLRRLYFATMETFGINPGDCCPRPVTDESEATIMLPELCSSERVSQKGMIEQILFICKAAGVSFDEAEIESMIESN
jgi:hypothetical protein